MINSYRRTTLPPALHRSPARILYQRGVTVDFPLRNGVQIHFVFKHTTLEYGALIKFRRLETISSKDVHTIHISIVAIHAAPQSAMERCFTFLYMGYSFSFSVKFRGWSSKRDGERLISRIRSLHERARFFK